jgi:hypothetical protein
MKKLEELYNKIPSMPCKLGCNDCCGPVPFSKQEAINAGINPGVGNNAIGFKCMFSGAMGCNIYKDRPIMCRLFGAVDDKMLTCPHGCKPEKPLTSKESMKIMTKYMLILDAIERRKDDE